MLYLWVKTFHVLFVIAWMAAVFYLPRILVNIAETDGKPEVQAHLALMGRRLYRFGHIMFGLAFVLGLVLWLGYRVLPDFPTMVAPGAAGWLHAKLGLVVLLLVYFIFTGRWPSNTAGMLFWSSSARRTLVLCEVLRRSAATRKAS